MKKRILAVVLALAFALSMTACGSSAPTQQDAEDCLKAILDLMLTGDYDENYEFSDMTRDEAMAMRNDKFEEGFVDAFLESLDLGDIAVSDEYKNDLAKKLLDYTNQGLSKVTYTIDGWEQTDEGFTGTVTFNPIKLYQVDEADVESMAMEYAQANMAKLQAMSEADMQADLLTHVMDQMVDYLVKGLDSPEAADPVTTTIKVLVEDNTVQVDPDSLDTALTDMMNGMI